ncbi:DUF2892 domain-containing protein [Leptospira gomenensis]|uniref:DUF2892 domain-containing protein n=1 Tax=Leptospira gomenensis TaxID=2484974 RepID=A0A5F1YF64_9LEPT|nr:YgaP-like transmembrane domain [Leptospira gomenensis]TGK38458.1 DUF2892 domain-containing protein [Leptospira gomenensis]TGK42573.1 DUF2892 domain-containing protein [Leptospira gomenensis]TGK45498.1 DUF2892 domain-containing protein [Leptospira gomenensis]TGK55821.1 DUF2892 domain-containing protein [Leptospira gomenensis]
MKSWYLERYLFLIAGTVSSIGLALGSLVNSWGFVLNLLVSINLILFSLTDFCPVAYLLQKLGVRSLKDGNGNAR